MQFDKSQKVIEVIEIAKEPSIVVSENEIKIQTSDNDSMTKKGQESQEYVISRPVR